MKIYVDEDVKLISLRRHLELEGNQIVSREQSEFVITNGFTGRAEKAMKGGSVFSSTIIRTLGYEVTDQTADFVISRWWDQSLFGWGRKVFFGVPIRGMMDGGIGADSEVGMVGRWGSSRFIESLFEREEIGGLLREIDHSGFVSFRISSEDGRIFSMETGIPSWGIYNVMEGLQVPMEEFLKAPHQVKVAESWTVSLLVTRFPYPMEVQTKEPVQIGNVSDGLEKHFWFGETQRFRSSVTTRSSVIGVSTAWSWRMNEASEIAVSNARNLSVKEIQFRSDAGIIAGQVWGRIKNLNVID